ncbi:MAG: DNA replication/repair protein RecF [Bacillota bacterium]
MYISEIYINEFRNLERIKYKPAKGVNILLGNNAQGKTNFLEAIYLLAYGVSFRAGHEKDLIRIGQNHFSIQAVYHYLDKQYSTAIRYTLGKRKQITINNKRNTLFNDRLVAILFTPDDLYLIKGSPQRRRAFLDNLLKNLSPEYKTFSDNYERLLNRRNAILKNYPIDFNMLHALDHVFTVNAAQVILARLNILKLLDELTLQYYNLLGGSESLNLKYALTFSLPSGMVNLDSIRDVISANLQAVQSKEIQRKSTIIGPHRDDINFYLDQYNARVFASQGQQRNIVVALKMAEIETFKRIRGDYPILLLDEVLAELDINKRTKLLEILQKSPLQTFMTSVDSSLFNNINGKIIGLEQGRLID